MMPCAGVDVPRRDRWTRALGARLPTGANDLKRTPKHLADEIGIPLPRIQPAQSAIDDSLRPDAQSTL